jgi:hypothetical protein
MAGTQDTHRSIYRDEALSHYQRRKDKPVLPYFFASHTSNCRYLLFFILLCNVWFLFQARIPVYVDGSATIVSQDRSTGERPTIIILFPPEYLNRVQVGQTLFLQTNSGDDRIHSSIARVEPQPSDAAALQQRFHLNQGATPAKDSAVAIALLGLVADPSVVSSDSGALYHVDIEIGTRRLGSFLPIIGQWLDNSP